jgi:branched-chain amino acid transport system permease protein
VAGLASGSIYAMVALGLSLVYRANRILNFAHGDIATLGTFFAFLLMGMGISNYISLATGLTFGFFSAVLFYFLVLVPAQRREANQLSQIILTLGFGLILQGLVLVFGGTEPKTFPFPLSDAKTYRFKGIVVDQLSMGTLLIGMVASLAFFILIQKTKIGLAIRATSENLQAAQTIGIPTRRILALAWGLSSFLGVLAGIFLAPALLLDPFFMLEPFLKGFAAAILGGLNSLPGAIVGGLILGVSEAMAGAYISVAFKNTFAFLVIILVLLIRPEGLLGEEFKERV